MMNISKLSCEDIFCSVSFCFFCFFSLFFPQITPLKALPVEALHLFKLQQTPCVCIFTPPKWYKTERIWACVTYLTKRWDILQSKYKIQGSWSEVSSLFWCVATVGIHHSDLCCVTAFERLLNICSWCCSSLGMCRYRGCSFQMDKNICTEAPQHPNCFM